MARLLQSLSTMTVILLLALAGAAQSGSAATVEGYVIDSSCAYTKSLDKPISADCARKCAKAGSPLVILTADGNVYWPISGGVPATGINKKLMPFAGEKVAVTGKVIERGGSKAIVIEKIERVASSKAAATD